jgi:hypothetical protein
MVLESPSLNICPPPSSKKKKAGIGHRLFVRRSKASTIQQVSCFDCRPVTSKPITASNVALAAEHASVDTYVSRWTACRPVLYRATQKSQHSVYIKASDYL